MGATRAIRIGDLKRCKRCGVDKNAVKAFTTGKGVCKGCHAEEQKKYYRKDPQAIFERNLRVRYHLTIDEFQAIKDEADNKCGVCGQPPTDKDPLVFDHSHETGKPRGYIHRSCNLMLGYAHDSVVRLAAAIAYLNRSHHV